MSIPLVVTWTCPFIPDLIMEESQGVANTMKILNVDLAGVIGSYLLDFNSKYPTVFSPFNLYVGIGILGLVSTVLV